MASLPKKGIKGTNFKAWAVETLNALIDYLHGARVKPGYGISVRETPSGTIVELAKKEAPTINNNIGGGGGVAQNISATVSGNTATVALSGSTSSVEVVGGSNVSITGNTNGQVVVSATGGTAGYPVWKNFTAEALSEQWTNNNKIMDPIVLDYSGYLRIGYVYHAYIHDGNPTFSEDVAVYIDGMYVWQKEPFFQLEARQSGDATADVLTTSNYTVDLIPVCAGSTVTATCNNLDDSVPSLYLELLHDTNA